MTPTPITLSLTPQQAAACLQLIEAAGKTLGAQSWGPALELLQAIQTGMQAAAKTDQERISALSAAADKPKET
jgi:hypothetical protein